MLKALYQALADKPWLLLLGFSFVVSSIGNGITYIVIFSELIRLAAPTTSLTLAYVLSTVPGLIGSKIGERYCQSANPFKILIVGECLGMLGLLAPLSAVMTGSTPLFLIAQTASAFTIGMTFPAISKIFKTGLTEKELPVATTLETIIFACYVIFGVCLGLLLLGHISIMSLLVLDASTFVIALILLKLSQSRFAKTFIKVSPSQAQINWRTLSGVQRRGILLLPLLALAAAPAMALLPALVPPTFSGSEAQSMALALLFARSLGQLSGPLILNPEKFEKNSDSNVLMVSCLFAFITCYGLVPFSPSKYLALAFIFMAHLFSNVVFSLAIYTILKKFDEVHISAAMAKSYRLQMMVTALVSIGAGYSAQYFGVVYSLYLFSGTGFVLIVMLSLGERWLKQKSVNFRPEQQ